MSCSTCQHHGFREMISKPYGYVGDIPCLRCSRLNNNDEYVPMSGFKMQTFHTTEVEVK